MIRRRLVAAALAAVLLPTAVAFARESAGQIEPRIVGGTSVPDGGYAFVVAVVDSSVTDARDGLVCGGTLIHPDWVLTAAHCAELFSDPDEADVVVGRTVLTGSDGERIGVAEISVHPDWDPDSFESDVALLRLEASATAGEVVFWATDYLAVWFEPGTMTTAAGWGFTEGKPPATGYGVQDRMREVDVPIRSDAECEASAPGEHFPEVMLCAGYPAGGRDACNGDSGGPIFVEEAGRYRQVGIVSWGYGCAEPGDYGFYTRLATFDDWIVDTTGLTTCQGALVTRTGTTGVDVIDGTDGDDVILARGGNDIVNAGKGDDIVCGGSGDDALYGQGGRDLLIGGDGEDGLFGGWGDDLLLGGSDADHVKGGDGDDLVLGGGGADEVHAGDGRDDVDGGPGADVLRGNGGADKVKGGDGRDEVYGGSDGDTVRGKAGDDLVKGGTGDDTLYGGTGIDTLVGGGGIDECRSGEIDFTGCETIV